MAEVHFKKDVEISISDSAFDYAKKLKEQEEENKKKIDDKQINIKQEILDILWYPEKEGYLKEHFPLTHQSLKSHIDEKTDKIIKLFIEYINNYVKFLDDETRIVKDNLDLYYSNKSRYDYKYYTLIGKTDSLENLIWELKHNTIDEFRRKT